MAEAAEKRLKQDEGRGMKDVEGYKRKLEQREKAEEQAKIQSQSQGAPLKVCVKSGIFLVLTFLMEFFLVSFSVASFMKVQQTFNVTFSCDVMQNLSSFQRRKEKLIPKNAAKNESHAKA